MMMEGDCIPPNIIARIFDFVTSQKDRNSMSLVCKTWFNIDSYTREKVITGNCYAINPQRMTRRFPRLKSLTLKGKPNFDDFEFPEHWGGSVYPWIQCLVGKGVELEELRLKRMVVSDICLELLSHSFAKFKSLVLIDCDRFTTRRSQLLLPIAGNSPSWMCKDMKWKIEGNG